MYKRIFKCSIKKIDAITEFDPDQNRTVELHSGQINKCINMDNIVSFQPYNHDIFVSIKQISFPTIEFTSVNGETILWCYPPDEFGESQRDSDLSYLEMI